MSIKPNRTGEWPVEEFRYSPIQKILCTFWSSSSLLLTCRYFNILNKSWIKVWNKDKLYICYASLWLKQLSFFLWEFRITSFELSSHYTNIYLTFSQTKSKFFPFHLIKLNYFGRKNWAFWTLLLNRWSLWWDCCWWIWSFKRILSQENTLWRK
jgi:hypothetical protein